MSRTVAQSLPIFMAKTFLYGRRRSRVFPSLKTWSDLEINANHRLDNKACKYHIISDDFFRDGYKSTFLKKQIAQMIHVNVRIVKTV